MSKRKQRKQRVLIELMTSLIETTRPYIQNEDIWIDSQEVLRIAKTIQYDSLCPERTRLIELVAEHLAAFSIPRMGVGISFKNTRNPEIDPASVVEECLHLLKTH